MLQFKSVTGIFAIGMIVVLVCTNGNMEEHAISPLMKEDLSSTNNMATATWPPLLDSGNPYPKSLDGRVIERFNHGSRSQWGYRFPQTNYFFLVHPKKKSVNAPLCVVLHSANRSALDYLGYCFLNRKADPGDNPGDFGEKVPNDFYGLFLDSNNDEWWGWTIAHSDEKKYSQTPTPTENRVLDSIEWVAKKYNIDRNRIYLTGVSMGGCGSLGIGMPNGNIFAALRVWVPAGTGYVACRMGNDPSLSAEAPNNNWEQVIIKSGHSDPPPVFDLSASNDTWSKDQDVLQNMALDGHLQLVVGWGPFGHTGSYSPVAMYPTCAAVLALPWMEIRKNEAYPVFTHASTDECPPWSKPQGHTDESGQINGYFLWKSVTDRTSEFAIRLWLERSPTEIACAHFPKQSVADVTLRRLQQFKVVPNQTYTWKIINGKKQMASGKINPDAAGLLTIPRVIISTDPEVLYVER